MGNTVTTSRQNTQPQSRSPDNFFVESPTRIDLAGGTLDLWPFYALLGPFYTINLAISILTRVDVRRLETNEIRISSQGMNRNVSYESLLKLKEVARSTTVGLEELVLSEFEFSGGWELTTSSQSPVGGGLGGSSSLVISLLKAAAQLEGQTLSDLEMIEIAHNIEARALGVPTGTQDYVPALRGGINIIRYDHSGCHLEDCIDDVEDFSERLVVVYTGRPHHSGLNNWEVYKKVVERDAQTIEALKSLGQVSEHLRVSLIKKDFDSFSDIFAQELKWRLRLSKVFSSPEIERLAAVIGKLGQIKICGAGGGGCVFVWVKSTQREEVVQLCQKNGFHTLEAAKPVAKIKTT